MKKTYETINQLAEDINRIAEETEDFDTADELNRIVNRLDDLAENIIFERIGNKK